MSLKTFMPLFVLMIFVAKCSNAQVKNNLKDSDFSTLKISNIINRTNGKPVYLREFKGKLVVIEFWATWCGPCISAMQHLDEANKQLKNRIQVIAISNESENRIKQFIKNRPYKFLFSVDTGQILNYQFFHRTIPHSIVIDVNGKYIGAYDPSDLSISDLKKLLSGEKINIKEKVDNTEFDSKVFFDLKPGISQNFNIQPGVPGMGVFAIPGEDEYKGRRMSYFNFPVSELYREAYNTTPFRMVYEVDKRQFDYNIENLYCLDVVVPPGGNVKEYMKVNLPKHFEMSGRMESKKVIVSVLKLIDISILESLKSDSTKVFYPLTLHRDYYKAIGSSISDFCRYLENFGVLKHIVIDETGLDEKYNIEFNYQLESPESLIDAFKKLGLKVELEERKVDMLVIYKDN